MKTTQVNSKKPEVSTREKLVGDLNLKENDSIAAVAQVPKSQDDEVIEIDLSKIKPMIARPHSPDNVVEVSDVHVSTIGMAGLIMHCNIFHHQDGLSRRHPNPTAVYIVDHC